MSVCTFKADVSKYIGIPYLSGGAGFDGCDCWGLVRLFYATEFNVMLPGYTDFSEGREPFIRTDNPKPYDVGLIARDGEILSHCVLLAGRRDLLHCLENTGVVLSRMEPWHHKIKYWYTSSLTQA